MDRIGTQAVRDAPAGSFVMDREGRVYVKGEEWFYSDPETGTTKSMGYEVRQTPFKIVGEEIIEEAPEGVSDYYGEYRSLEG